MRRDRGTRRRSAQRTLRVFRSTRLRSRTVTQRGNVWVAEEPVSFDIAIDQRSPRTCSQGMRPIDSRGSSTGFETVTHGHEIRLRPSRILRVRSWCRSCMSEESARQERFRLADSALSQHVLKRCGFRPSRDRVISTKLHGLRRSASLDWTGVTLRDVSCRGTECRDRIDWERHEGTLGDRKRLFLSSYALFGSCHPFLILDSHSLKRLSTLRIVQQLFEPRRQFLGKPVQPACVDEPHIDHVEQVHTVLESEGRQLHRDKGFQVQQPETRA